MSFDDDERSVDSQPREFYEIAHGTNLFDLGVPPPGLSGGTPLPGGVAIAPTSVYRIASGDRDIIYNGFTFTAMPASRTELQINPLTAEFSLVLSLASEHPFARRYTAVGGVPPQQVTVIGRRKQLNSGDVQQFLDGVVASAAFEGSLFKLSIQDRVKYALDRQVPSVLVDSICANVLYDSWCGVNSNTVLQNAVVNTVYGRIIGVSTVGGNPDQWARGGLIAHLASGEVQTIDDQSGLTITMQYPIAELKSGDSVAIFPGCDHTATTCRDKYSNISNFAGAPSRPTKNPFISSGLGVEENQ